MTGPDYRKKPCPRCNHQRVEAGWVLNSRNNRRRLIWHCICGWTGPRKEAKQ